MSRKKLNQDILSVRDGAAKGQLGEITKMTREDGSPVLGAFAQELSYFDMIDVKTGEVNKYWLDAGLRGTFKMAKIKPGMKIEIVHTGEKKIEWTNVETGQSGTGKVQTYDIFDLE